jgi:hypothetical protein
MKKEGIELPSISSSQFFKEETPSREWEEKDKTRGEHCNQ